MSFKKKFFFFSVIFILLISLIFIYGAIRYYSGKTRIENIVKEDNLVFQITISDPLSTFEALYASPVWDVYYDIPRLISIKESIDALKNSIDKDSKISFLAPFLNGEVNAFGVRLENGETEQVYSAQMGFKLSFLQSTGLFDLLTTLVTSNVERENYPGFGAIFHLDLPAPYEDISFTIRNGFMFIAFNPDPILRLLEGEKTLGMNRAYLKTYLQIDKDNILKYFYKPLITKEEYNEPGLLRDLLAVSEGIAGEVTAENLTIEASGRIELNDSLLSRHPLKSIVGNSPLSPAHLELIPSGCAGFARLNIGSFQELFENTLLELSKNEALYRKYMESKKYIEEDIGINIKQDLAAWIGHEISVAVFTPRTYRSSAEKAIIIETRNKLMAMDAMERVADALSDAFPINFETVNYRGYLIHQIELPFYLNVFFGRLFDDMPKPFYTFIENAFVATDEKETLELLIDNYLAERSIQTDPIFNEIVKGDEPSNVLIYANLSRGLEILNDIFATESEESWNSLKPYLAHAKGGMLELTKLQNGQLSYKFTLQLKERAREKMTKQWQTEIPDPMPYAPLMVTENPDEAPDIYVFTANGKTYRYNFFGEAFDKGKKLALKFYSEPVQINNDGEIFFYVSTGSKIREYDINLVPGKTYRAKDIISAPPLVDLSKDRIYFTDWSGTFYAYELSSERLIQQMQLTSISKTSPIYLRVNNVNSEKLIVTASADGTVYYFGEKDNPTAEYDSLYFAEKISLKEGISSRFCNVNWDSHHYIAFGAWTGIVHVLDALGKERITFPQKLTGRIEAGLNTVNDEDQTFLIVSTTAKMLYLLDEDANIPEGWPVRVYGSILNKPSTYDLDGDNEPEILALAEDGRLYAFKLNGELVRQWPIIASAMPSFYGRGTKHYMAVADWNEKLSLWLLPAGERSTE